MVKVVTIGDMEAYVGMRGYPKEKATVYLTDEKGENKQAIGVCKVEPVLDSKGELITTIVYPRISFVLGGTRLGPVKGQPWQFASRRALTQFLQKQVDESAVSGLDKAYKKSDNYVELDAEDAMKQAAKID